MNVEDLLFKCCQGSIFVRNILLVRESWKKALLSSNTKLTSLFSALYGDCSKMLILNWKSHKILKWNSHLGIAFLIQIVYYHDLLYTVFLLKCLGKTQTRARDSFTFQGPGDGCRHEYRPISACLLRAIHSSRCWTLVLNHFLFDSLKWRSFLRRALYFEYLNKT